MSNKHNIVLMKKIIILHIFILTCLTAFGQKALLKRCGPVTTNRGSGYMNINELHYGYGIASAAGLYGRQFAGFTSIHGYQLNIFNLDTDNSLLLGGGAGIYTYGSSFLLPVFMDIRFVANYKKISPFVYEETGLLVSTDELKAETRMFINGGVGVKVKMSRTLSVGFGGGLMIQMGDNVYRDSFFSLRAGIFYKPW